MEPNITLIWFVQPQWFQKMGAFARRENIPVFVEWCETAFKLFGETPPEHTYLTCRLGLAAQWHMSAAVSPRHVCQSWLSWSSVPGTTCLCTLISSSLPAEGFMGGRCSF